MRTSRTSPKLQNTSQADTSEGDISDELSTRVIGVVVQRQAARFAWQVVCAAFYAVLLSPTGNLTFTEVPVVKI